MSDFLLEVERLSARRTAATKRVRNDLSPRQLDRIAPCCPPGGQPLVFSKTLHTKKPSTHDSAGAHRGAKNTRRPMPSPVDSSADVHPIVQGAT